MPNFQMSEKDLLQAVRDMAQVYGWMQYHTWRSIHSPAGFPDLVLVNITQHRIVYAELKTMKGIVTPAQQAWLDALRACGQETYLWRPMEWFDGTIEDVLK